MSTRQVITTYKLIRRDSSDTSFLGGLYSGQQVHFKIKLTSDTQIVSKHGYDVFTWGAGSRSTMLDNILTWVVKTDCIMSIFWLDYLKILYPVGILLYVLGLHLNVSVLHFNPCIDIGRFLCCNPLDLN